MQCFFLLLSFLCGSLLAEAPDFAFSLEEMVFAAKLSDENRRTFCYVFSSEERKAALEAANLSTPNAGVEQVIASSEEVP